MPHRRVLMIAHHFPPAGGSGSNRALAFARYLPEYGWAPVVITPAKGWAANRDDDLLAQLPPGLQVIRTRSFEPKPIRSGLPLTRSFRAVSSTPRGRGGTIHEPPTPSGGLPLPLAEGRGEGYVRHPNVIRSNLGHLKRFPDAHLGWLPFALAAARRQEYDVAYSSSGPFTSHLVGLILKRLKKRPWIVELRDGWYRWNRAIFPDYPAWRDLLERRLEAAAIRSADRIVLVTERMAAAFRAQYTDLPSDRYAVVSNGFDAAQFTTSAAEPGTSSSTFHVLHAGALYYGRSLAAFLEAARRLIVADEDFVKEFRLTLLGTLDPRAASEVGRSGLDAHVHIGSQVTHAAALQAMGSADLLLLVANTTQGADVTVPGKLFEYLAVGRPIFAVAPPDSATADILSLTGGGWLAPSGDPAAIACVLHQAFSAHRGDQTKLPDPKQVARFDRRILAADLAQLLDEAVANQGAARRD